ncbi:DUF3379 family protein [Fimbriiglobus ruber]|uniref:Zinc-finger domain-containing protein n=1 Tax=Fimbriiglobus ruber TaxID=1908690 RepID=A0A225DPF1_9BACT|nr:DUF3379 family protein [Fimbriiglobus ruber]OWK38235.1 hypothetical protein FRUB_07355 [Fimbriiglobus ruber]
MNCETARSLLAFRRPGGPAELAPEDAAALARHCAACPACAALASRDAAFDTAVASAMKAVPVPVGLRDRLVASARTGQAARLRRTVGFRLAFAASVMATGALGYGGYLKFFLPAPDATEFVKNNENAMDAPENEVALWLSSQSLPPHLPLDFDYRLFRDRGTEPFQGRDVPVVRFDAPAANGRQDWVKVYILRDTQFNLRNLKSLQTAEGSLCFAQVDRDPAHPGVAYVYVFTTPTLKPFLKATTHHLARAASDRVSPDAICRG